MHPEAYEGFRRMLERSGLAEGEDTPPYDHLRVLDFGGQNVNGTVHDHLPGAQVTTLDIQGADIVADATCWEPGPGQEWDVVIATEFFEHVAAWRRVVMTMRKCLRPGGVLLATCASTDRGPHGMWGEGVVPYCQHYANVPPEDLDEWLGRLFLDHEVEYAYPPGDAYMWARA